MVFTETFWAVGGGITKKLNEPPSDVGGRSSKEEGPRGGSFTAKVRVEPLFVWSRKSDCWLLFRILVPSLSLQFDRNITKIKIDMFKRGVWERLIFKSIYHWKWRLLLSNIWGRSEKCPCNHHKSSYQMEPITSNKTIYKIPNRAEFMWLKSHRDRSIFPFFLSFFRSR